MRGLCLVVGLLCGPGLLGCPKGADPVDDVLVDAGSPDVDVAPDVKEPDPVPSDEGPPDNPPIPPGLAWDAEPGPPECAKSAPDAPLLAQALGETGLTRDTFRFTTEDLSYSAYEQDGRLNDPFRFPWYRDIQFVPETAACFAREHVAGLDEALSGAHPVAAAIRRAALLADRWEEGEPRNPLNVGSFEHELKRATSVADPSWDPGEVELPEELKAALTPVFAAIADGLLARRDMLQSQTVLSADNWMINGGIGTSVFGVFTQLLEPEVVTYLVGAETRPALNLAAARLAWALESVDWTSLEQLTGVAGDIMTPLGWIRIREAETDLHKPVAEPVFFSLDLGGDDIYTAPVGATTHGNVGVNIAVDLGGTDLYGYEVVATPYDADYLAPADLDGRYEGDAFYGPISASNVGRQGSARNGIAMLLDYGGQADTYSSLTKSQGYAHLGVGVLYDDGGDDFYEAEAASQGCSAYGIGLLLDAAGDDRYRGFWKVQGSASVAGVAILWDGGGDDDYFANPGSVEGKGEQLYFSPQVPDGGNSSLSQGAASGVRWDDGGVWVSGGLGILRDRSGNDRYMGSVMAQGVGFWQGTGILSDGSGEDTYDAYWYVQGAGAHYALGMLLDGGPGGDFFNTKLTSITVQLGGGHDYSLGLLINERGDDVYHFGSLAAGASNCNGIGLFVDNAGADTYVTASTYNLALGNVSDECVAQRPEAVSIGVFLDAGGTDIYDVPHGNPPVDNDASFGHITHALDTEHGAGLDAEGETGLHAD
ncbi:MAG: hypothetical protein ACI9WU_000632 [Myxococcota bacterium]|jgi:hypothetical protein